MKDHNHIIAVTILGRQYKIKCPPEQAQDLQESAQLVDAQMKKLQHTDHHSNTDQVAVVTALNMCHEWLLLKKQRNQYIDNMNEHISQLHKKIENFIANHAEITV